MPPATACWWPKNLLSQVPEPLEMWDMTGFHRLNGRGRSGFFSNQSGISGRIPYSPRNQFSTNETTVQTA